MGFLSPSDEFIVRRLYFGKRVPTSKFILWVTVMAAGWAGLFNFFQSQLDQTGLASIKVTALEKKVRQEKRLASRLDLQLSEYKDAVALAGVKVDENTPWHSESRMIASTFSDPRTKVTPILPTGRKLLESGVAAFRTERYERATDLLDKFIGQFPEHPRAPEAAYLLAESYFYLHRVENTVRSIDLIITHYPETPFAAYALLRLASIMEVRERIEEASEVYESILANYPGSAPAAMAEKNLRGLNL